MATAIECKEYSWWDSLKHGGMLIAPGKLSQYFEDTDEPIDFRTAEDLRRNLLRALEKNARAEEKNAFIDTVTKELCGLRDQEGSTWVAGSSISTEYSVRGITGEAIRPRRIWQGKHGENLPLFVEDMASIKSLGIGKGRRSYSRVLEWLRKKDKSIALLTNLKQWRLVYAGSDHEAWVEWDTSMWFEEGKPGDQVKALIKLLGLRSISKKDHTSTSSLLEAIKATRQSQAEVSSYLGERIRQAVETLIRSYDHPLDELKDQCSPRDIYIAACRVVMRMVVILFAEARDNLLPQSAPVYHNSYSLQGLRALLERTGAGSSADRLKHQVSAWPRVLGLFRLIYSGSIHEDLNVPKYGGDLFAPGDRVTKDPVGRALAIFEDPALSPKDSRVHKMLQYLCKSKVKVRSGRGATFVPGTVDFSTLSSEYIGILYEGLLDFELKQAVDEPYIFLNLGNQPVLPLSRMEEMDDSTLKKLLENLKKESKGDDDSEEEEETPEEDNDDDDDEENPDEESSSEEDQEGTDDEDDLQVESRQRSHTWALRAVDLAKLVRKPRNRNAEALAEYEQKAHKAAQNLIARLILPGERFLVRWGGTRKGAGTFYTKPGLAVPTVHRTLEILIYEDCESEEKIFKDPDEILSLKVCDTSMGSGSFLVAGLRYLSRALYNSIFQHGWIVEAGGRLTMPDLKSRPTWFQTLCDALPVEPETAEARIESRLKRCVVERCIYGVDIDPLAVELAKLALWIETMDRDLPFEFLDHKIKAGNSLVGCWFDRFREYPIMAWEREGGDKGHNNGVHYQKEEWTKAIKAKKSSIKEELKEVITGQRKLGFDVEGESPEEFHQRFESLFQEFEAIPLHEPEIRAEHFRIRILTDPAFKRLKQAFDTWCALWFWPPDQLENAPEPRDYPVIDSWAEEIVDALAQEHRFFHWELEFPDVFTGPESGFDAIIGNPPWETLQPNSKEYFSNIDPLYRGYGKQEALDIQHEIFDRNKSEEEAWLLYNCNFKALANWNKTVGLPFGDEKSLGTRFPNEAWLKKRQLHTTYSDPGHPFISQGEGKAYTYKMFLELNHALIRKDGVMGVIVPSGVYTDKGTTELRELFVEECRWKWLFGFENRNKVFEIHRSFKFCPVIVQKGGATEAIRSAFMRRDLSDWEEAEKWVIPYTAEQITRFSPNTKAILEVGSARDLDLLEKIYQDSVLLGDQSEEGWGIRYSQGDFNMTSDSKLFPPLPKWEEKGYKPDEYGRWLKGEWQPIESLLSELRVTPLPEGETRVAQPPYDTLPIERVKIPEGIILSREAHEWIREEDIEDVALPLYEGRMIGQFDFSEKGWVSGKGRSAEWREIPWENKVIEPQYLMGEDTFDSVADKDGVLKGIHGLKASYMAIGSATNIRSGISALVNNRPCGNAVPVLKPKTSYRTFLLSSIISSFNFDFILRLRLGGININYFIMEETVLPSATSSIDEIVRISSSLLLSSFLFSDVLLKLKKKNSNNEFPKFALTPHERLRLRCALDAMVAELYGLDWDDLAWILKDCDHPVEDVCSKGFARNLDPKGFWRVDKDKHPELRHTVLTLHAFHELKEFISKADGDREKGIQAFCDQNDGEGYMLPETFRLKDLNLGHDERAWNHQPVQSLMGARYLPWQLKQTSEEAWKECLHHARNMLGEKGFKRLIAQINGEEIEEDEETSEESSGEMFQGKLFPEPTQSKLFDQ